MSTQSLEYRVFIRYFNKTTRSFGTIQIARFFSDLNIQIGNILHLNQKDMCANFKARPVIVTEVDYVFRDNGIPIAYIAVSKGCSYQFHQYGYPAERDYDLPTLVGAKEFDVSSLDAERDLIPTQDNRISIPDDILYYEKSKYGYSDDFEDEDY